MARLQCSNHGTLTVPVGQSRWNRGAEQRPNDIPYFMVHTTRCLFRLVRSLCRVQTHPIVSAGIWRCSTATLQGISYGMKPERAADHWKRRFLWRVESHEERQFRLWMALIRTKRAEQQAILLGVRSIIALFLFENACCVIAVTAWIVGFPHSFRFLNLSAISFLVVLLDTSLLHLKTDINRVFPIFSFSFPIWPFSIFLHLHLPEPLLISDQTIDLDESWLLISSLSTRERL